MCVCIVRHIYVNGRYEMRKESSEGDSGTKKNVKDFFAYFSLILHVHYVTLRVVTCFVALMRNKTSKTVKLNVAVLTPTAYYHRCMCKRK